MATYNSNLIVAGGGQATPTIIPGTKRAVYGSITIAANTTIALNDTMPLFNVQGPNAAHIVSFWFDFPILDGGNTLTLSLIDTLASPTTIVSASTTPRAGGFVSHINAVHATFGSAISYQAPNLLFLKAAAGATNSVGGSAVVIYFDVDIAQD